MDIKTEIDSNKMVSIIERVSIDEKARNTLKLPIDTLDNKFRKKSVREFLKELLFSFWILDSVFDPRSPGIYGPTWKNRVYLAMVKDGLICGKVDPAFNEPMDFNEAYAEKIVLRAIELL